MGACDFATRVDYIDADEAFEVAVSEARLEFGRGGYTGTVAEKAVRGFRIIRRSPVTMSKAMELIDLETPRNQKFGPAFALPVAEDADPGTTVGWIFFGLASC